MAKDKKRKKDKNDKQARKERGLRRRLEALIDQALRRRGKGKGRKGKQRAG